jgi:hypothetical protein
MDAQHNGAQVLETTREEEAKKNTPPSHSLPVGRRYTWVSPQKQVGKVGKCPLEGVHFPTLCRVCRAGYTTAQRFVHQNRRIVLEYAFCRKSWETAHHGGALIDESGESGKKRHPYSFQIR